MSLQFFDKYGHAPQSDKQNKEYHDLMKKYVGHIDISVEKILGLSCLFLVPLITAVPVPLPASVLPLPLE